jgi:DNA-binding Xre family transcriptional regulator
MSVRINLKQFIREYEAARQRDVTWAQISAGTGISETTLNRLLNDKSHRVDLDVLARLCQFFDVASGPVPFILFEREAVSGSGEPPSGS